MSRGGRLLVILLAVAWTLAGPAASPATAQSDLEYSVKANYLVRFAAFVEWPPRAFAGPQAPMVICIMGRDPFGARLERAARGQTAYGRPLAIRRPASREAAAGCHILYLGAGAAAPPAESQTGMLLVTDAAAAADRGMIHFVLRDARVRFHIDDQAARRSGLVISSRLLNLALSVRAD
ncbi:MAG: YfiR family protein [Alphaproteobacteria bacterium]|nr:YfiR family protein [Alphaproteobacteria bacterium]